MKTRLALLGLALAAGCADNRASIQIVGICALPDDGCTFTSGKCSAYNGEQLVYDVQSGVLDRDGWILPVEVKNQLPTNGDGKIGVNTNNALVTEVTAEFDALGAPYSFPSSTERIAQNVPANGSATIFISPISFGLSNWLADYLPTYASGDPTTVIRVIARTRLSGRFDNGSTFETGEFEIPVSLCVGCLPPAVACVAPEFAVGCPGVGQFPGTSGCSG